jgi:iron complex outermembrane receptor protein
MGASWSSLGASLLAGVLINPLIGWADEAAAPDQLQEVIVTAQRSKQNIQDVPVDVTSVSMLQLSAAHIENTYDLSSVAPGLTSYQSSGFFMPHLRGVGNTVDSVGIESPVAVYVDGVFFASPSGALLSLNSIERIEVDEGPQGTLFGRNATGGVIQVITRDPSQAFGGEASIGYGNYNTVNATAYVTGRVATDLAADLAIYYSNRNSGYGTNLHNGEAIGTQNDAALRTKWMWTPTARDTLRLSVDYEYSYGNQFLNNRFVSGTIPLGTPVFSASNAWDVNMQTQPRDRVEQGGIALDFEHDFRLARLKNISAYRRTKANPIFSLSLAPFDVGASVGQLYSQFSEELQLLSRSESKVKWVAGVFYLDAPAESDPYKLFGDFFTDIVRIPSTPITTNTISDQSEAIYGQTTIPLPMASDLTIGGRYTTERRSIYGDVGLSGIPASLAGVSASESFRAPSWHVALDHHFTDDVMGYISDSRGFRAGTYNASGTSVKALETGVRPEYLDAYEIGLKTELFNRSLRLNGAAFYYNYKDMQVPIYSATGVRVLSGPKAHLYGADFDANWMVNERLSFQAGLALLHTNFASFPSAPFFANAPGGGLIEYGASAEGKQLPVAPEQTFNISSTYRVPLASGAALSFSGNYYYEAHWYSGPDNGLAAPATHLLNGSIAWSLPGDRMEVSVWGHNLLDKEIVSRLSEVAPWGDQETLEPPRTYGITVRYEFE